jgi:hypothetical protein
MNEQGKRTHPRAFSGIVIIAAAITGGVVTIGTPSAAQTRDLGRRINQAIKAEGPVLTDADRALIREKCGYRGGEWKDESIHVHNGVLHCSNGRQVDDPEVRAMMKRVGERARAHVERVMRRPEIKAAISGEASARAREAVRRMELHRPHIDAAAARARSQIARIDMKGVRSQALREALRESGRAVGHVHVVGPDMARMRAELEEMRSELARVREELRREREAERGDERED